MSALWTGKAFAKIYSVPKHNIEDPSIIKAREGFNELESLPNHLEQAWNSVFVIYAETANKPFHGTSFLVKKIVKENTVDLYFLTNSHVTKVLCRSGICLNTFLKENINLYTDEQNQLFYNHVDTIAFKKITLVAESENPDLALLKVTANKIVGLELKPLTIDSCALRLAEPLYTIGFSSTVDRTASNSLPIQNKNTTAKRWSEGVFTGYTKTLVTKNPEVWKQWAGTSVDVLTGGSGGPLLNGYGQVVGVVSNMADLKNGYAYAGSEEAGKLKWHSNSVRCDYLKDFIDRSLNKSQN